MICAIRWDWDVRILGNQNEQSGVESRGRYLIRPREIRSDDEGPGATRLTRGVMQPDLIRLVLV